MERISACKLVSWISATLILDDYNPSFLETTVARVKYLFLHVNGQCHTNLPKAARGLQGHRKKAALFFLSRFTRAKAVDGDQDRPARATQHS